jgi:DNA-binding transcriptional LysR family regulator
MDRFESMRAFVKVVEHGGFAAAGRAIRMSRSAVNKHVIALEDRLGAQLLTRTTRKVTPTDTGYAYYERCLAILGDLESAEVAAAQLQQEARGTLKVSAPMTFGTMHLSRLIADFMGLYPDLRIELTLSDHLSDPMADGADLNVRITAPPGPANLVSHRIVEGQLAVCASPDYVAAHGAPGHPGELSARSCLHYGNLAAGNVWQLTGPDGEHAVRVTGTLCSNNGEVLRDAALAGRGIAMLPTFIIGADLQSGRLISLLTDYAPPQLAIFVLYPHNRHLSAKIRLFTAFVQERFAGRPYWDLVG